MSRKARSSLKATRGPSSFVAAVAATASRLHRPGAGRISSCCSDRSMLLLSANRGVIVIALISPIERPVRMAIHDCRRKRLEGVHTGIFPKYFARYREQRPVHITLVADGVAVAISGAANRFNETG